MEQKNKNRCIIILFVLLVCSLLLNVMQGNCIDSLINQVRKLEYTLSASHSFFEYEDDTDDAEHGSF